MSVYHRNGSYYYKFEIDGERYRGTFNEKKGKPFARTKKEAEGFETELQVSIRNGSYIQATGIKDFGTFLTKCLCRTRESIKLRMSTMSGWAKD